METSLLNRKLSNSNGLLYPMLVIAAVSVIIFSGFGVAMMTGLLPRAESMSESHEVTPHAVTQSKTSVASSQDATCVNCGVVESITPVETKAAHGTGLGMVAGGITGALRSEEHTSELQSQR